MMKQFLFATFLSILSLECSAQHLSYNDLKFILRNDLDKVDTYLGKKGFTYYKSNDNNDINVTETTWAYNRSVIDNKAIRFVIKTCKSNICGVFYQLLNKIDFESIKINCKSLGFKLDKSYSDQFGDLCFDYSTKTIQIHFSSGIGDENENVYYISLSNKSSIIQNKWHSISGVDTIKLNRR